MTESHFEIKFGNNWKKFRDVLRATAPQVIESFRGTRLEDNFSGWYGSSVPQKRESPINFLLRNDRRAYAPTNGHNTADIGANMALAKIVWYTGRIPLLRGVMRLDSVSSELYIGQEANGYVSEKEVFTGNGFGNDRIKVVISNLSKPMDLDIDVGFTNPNTPKRGRDWFYKINVFADDLIVPAERAYRVIARAQRNGGN